MVLAAALLVVSFGLVGWFVRDDRAEYARFKELTQTADRQRRYRVWALKSFVLFSVSTLGGLLILGRLSALTTRPVEFEAVSQALRAAAPIARLANGSFLLGIVPGIIAALVVAVVVARRARKSKPVVIGDIAPLMPQNNAEAANAALLSVNAGLSEELFFRLLLPLLLTQVIGRADIAFVAAAIVFGLVHAYQGIAGVVGTTVLGLALTIVYLWTGNLWLAIVVHASIDLVSLVLRPTVVRLIG